jgi:glycosyltransferase involved in cell wall biosynthesis
VGLSIARNKGLQEAVGAYVAYMDDDARATQEWLSSILNAFVSVKPAPSIVGGPVKLDWQGEKPSWIPDEYLSLYTCVDYG